MYPWVKDTPPTVTVNPGSFGASEPAIRDKLRQLPHSITDEDIERDKAGNRGLFMDQFLAVLARCDDGDPDDPRWDELRLRTLDRLAKLTRVYEPDAPSVKRGPGNPKDLAETAARALAELEASLAETRAS